MRRTLALALIQTHLRNQSWNTAGCILAYHGVIDLFGLYSQTHSYGSQGYKMADHRLKIVVFTDLDGTLLDRTTYSYASAVPALESLRQKKIPIVFCSAKTSAEQEAYRKELGIGDPFIVENGGAIFIPYGYFPFEFDYHKTIGGNLIIE